MVDLSARNVIRLYRAAVRVALADGGLTEHKEDHGAEVAEHLSLGPRNALRIGRDIEQEVHT